MWNRLAGSERRKPAARKPRRLLMDQLEERTLLSISAGGTTDQLINQSTITLPSQLTSNNQGTYAESTQAMVTGKSVATDNNGDFVVVWSQNDGVFDANGNPIMDSTGQAMSDDNVYARYYTEAMQRIDVPAGVTSFQIHYGGDEVQKLTISAAKEPYQSVTSNDNTIAGTFTLTFGGYTTEAISFSETPDLTQNVTTSSSLNSLNNAQLAQNASNIQQALRDLGSSANIAALQDITVQAVDADDYLIDFGGKSNGVAQPLFSANIPTTSLAAAVTASASTITVADASQFPVTGSTFTPFVIQVDNEQMLVEAVGGTGDATWVVERGYNGTSVAAHFQDAGVEGLTGLAAAVTATAVRTPGTITVPVSNDPTLTAAQNMAQTADNIQYAFTHTTSQIVFTAPYLFPPDTSIAPTGPQGPYYEPVSVPLAMPAVSVTARSATEFDISFTGDEGYNEQPALQILDTSNQQVQQVQFTPSYTYEYAGVPELYGTFTLKTGKGTTSSIYFYSDDLSYVASQVKSALVALGYSSSTSVAFNSNTSPFTMSITWSAADTASGVIPLVQCTTSMSAAVTVSYGDGKPLAGASVQIIKESSDTFRVNDPEPVWNPANASRPPRYNQTNAQVAMDADGDFVITWQSYVPNSVTPGSSYDIFARRFSPAGYVNQVQTIQFTPDATATLSSGTVTLTTGRGVTQPIPFNITDADPFGALAARVQAALISLGYDPATKVTAIQQGASYVLQITWGGNDTATSIPLVQVSTTLAGTVQVTSNLPFVADMNHDGTPDTPIESVVPLGGQFQVNTFTANPQTSPSIGMDENGDFTIAWQSEGQGLSFFNIIEAQRFDSNGNPLGNEFMVDMADNTTINYDPYVAMADDGTFAISWTNTSDPNYINGGPVADNVRAQIYNAQGTVVVNENTMPSMGGGQSTVAFDSADDFTITWEHLVGQDDIQNDGTAEDCFGQEYQLYDHTTGLLSFSVIQAEFRVNSANSNTGANDFWPHNQTGVEVAMDADGDMVFSYDGFGPAVTESNSTTISGSSTGVSTGSSGGNVDQTEVDALVQNISYSEETLTFNYSDIYGNPLPHGNVLPANYQTYFRLSISGVGTTGDLLFDITSAGTLATTAADIATALQNLTGDAGLTVTYQSGAPTSSTSSYTFLVTFSSTVTVGGQPAVAMLAPATSGAPALPAKLVSTFVNPDLTSLGQDQQALESYYGLLRGDANAAMFTQFDADPSLKPGATTVLTSDDIANASRDGQNATYYLDIDPYAVSGAFTVELDVLTNQGKDNKIDVTVTPVFYPNNGAVDPDKTIAAIKSALAAATNLGTNWPTSADYAGPVDVQLVWNPLNTGDPKVTGNFADEIGSPWDPTAQGIDRGSYVYQVTFQGEVHDTFVSLTLAAATPSTLTRAAATTAAQQLITFSAFSGTGWLSMMVGTIGPSADFSVSSSQTPLEIAATLQNSLQSLVPGTTVTLVSNTSSTALYNFLVTFPTAETLITISGPKNTTLTALAPTPSASLLGVNSPAPHIAEIFYGWDGAPYNSPISNTVSTGSYGTSIAMTSSGSFVEVWNEDTSTNDGSYSNTNLEFRTFQESTDTAGPLVTNFVDPYTGDSMQNGDTITDQMNYLVVTFDSDMMTTGPNSVTNPNNWSLLLNGTPLTNGISAIYYGMNEAADNPLFASLHASATNKWQAVIVLNGQGSNQGTTSASYLQDGHYQLIATTALEDAAGNALGRTGFKVDGASFSRTFNVVLPTKGETLVNTGNTTGSQITSEPNSQATASDANGDYVVVWSSAAGQNLPFKLTSPGTGGYFRLVFNGTNTSDIYFNPTNLATTAANIQAALAAVESGTTVIYDAVDSNASTGSFVFDVSLSVTSAVVNRPLITMLGPTSYAATPLAATMTAVPNSGAGLYATLYTANWTGTTLATNGHQSNPKQSAPVFITSANGTRTAGADTAIGGTTLPSGTTFNYLNASNVSVACDGTGNFVVTWSEEDILNGTPDWNVWAARYKSDGTLLSGPFEVNATTKNAQRYSAVAMDADGDFVITWQSMGQDGSGYGIYAQRYDNAGVAIGGTNALDVLSFTGNPTSAAFTLSWNGQTTAPLTFSPGSAANYTTTFAAAVQAALRAIGANVTVIAADSTDFGIQFVGVQGSQFQPPVTINVTSLSGGTSPAATVSARLTGAAGEFLVNDTTANNQMWPSIAMDATGSFVISWTSYGQGGDAANQSSVYAKQFVANSVLEATSAASTLGVTSSTSLSSTRASSTIPGATYAPVITTTDDPTKHIVAPDSALDGVVEIIVTATDGSQWLGSGSVLMDGIHILTAAHVVVGDTGTEVPAQIQVIFPTASSEASDASFNVNPNNVTYTFNAQLGVNAFANPNFDGDPLDGGDVGIITLPQAAPASVQRYDIARQDTALGQVCTMVGYGLTGTGAAGSTVDSEGTEHVGQNKYDATDTLLGGAGDTLIFEFSSGQAKNDVFGQVFGIHDLGLGAAEADIAPGDSGGPEFVNGLIAGINDYIYEIPGPWDAVAGLNSSFGEIGGAVNVALYATWIDSITSSSGAETLVNQSTTGNSEWSSVAMDAAGDFVVTWTSYGQASSTSDLGNSGNHNEVYARRFNSNGTAAGNEFLVNTTTAGNQQYSKVAMDAAGDFTIVWEGAKTSAPSSAGTPTSYGIYAQSYVRTSLIGNPSYFTGPNGEYETQFTVNTTQAGSQRYPGIAMDDNGDSVVVWSGNGQDYSTPTADNQGIFLQRFDLPTDTAGPRPIQTYAYDASATGRPVEVHNNDNLTVSSTDATTDITKLVVVFSEALEATTNPSDPLWANSVCNPANWTLWQDGTMVAGGVQSVTFGFNSVDDKYEATVTFNKPLGSGSHAYKLQALDAIQDVFGNALDGTSSGVPGSNFVLNFTINVAAGTVIPTAPPNPVWTPPGVPTTSDTDTLVSNPAMGTQDSPTVASDANGDYVVVWVAHGLNGVASGSIVGQLYDQYGQAQGSQFVIDTDTSDNQSAPAVAMDAEGDFVVAWADAGSQDPSGVYARVYDQFGKAEGDQFLVNQYPSGLQNEPAVAMDVAGDFVVSWTSYGQNGAYDGVYARRFNLQGTAVTGEIQVNTTVLARQDRSAVAMDQNGDFTVVWEGYGQSNTSWNVYGQRFNAAGAMLGGQFQINQHTNNQHVMDPKVAMDLAGDFVVTWQSYGQDGSGYGIYARRYNAAAAAQGNEFLVNNLITANWQMTPDVGMDANGDFIITWSSFGQDQQASTGLPVAGYSYYGISCRMFNADGSDYQFTDPTTGKVTSGEWRVNATLNSNEMTPVIGVGQNEEFAIAWVQESSSDNQIYSRLVNPDPTVTTGSTSGPTSAVGSLPSQVATSNFTVSWSGKSAAGASVTGYSVYVSVDGGPFSLWLNNTTATQATYAGQSGQSYAFFSVASDSSGDVETPPATADASTLVTVVVGGSTIGLYNPTSSTFYLRNSNSTGFATTAFAYGPANSNLITLVGDWNGDGADTIGLYNPATSMFFLSDSNVSGFANDTFVFGPANSGDIPLVGDWNGDGKDTIGLYNPTTSMFFLKNSNSTGFADVAFVYGPANSGWTPLVGDWNGDGKDTVALYNPTTSMFYERNTNTTGFANTAFVYGPAKSGWKPLAGDWTGSGTDSIGLYNPAASMFYLRNSNTTGFANTTFTYGPANAGYVPLIGNWTGAGEAEMAAAQGTAPQNAPTLTQSDLQPIVNEAIDLWSQAGLNAATLQKLRQAQFVISDLPGGLVGETAGNVIYLDTNAADNGWFIDPTPAANEEFSAQAGGQQLQAVDPRAVDHIDLLTVVEHELGHVAGLGDLNTVTDDLMNGVLGTGVRRLASHVDAVLAS
jgi:hypothetical protein